MFKVVSRPAVPLNKFPRWVYGVILICVILAGFYALPMLYGESPSVQLTPKSDLQWTAARVQQGEAELKSAGISPSATRFNPDILEFKFKNTEDQLKAYDVLNEAEGKNAVVALNLSPNTPRWFRFLGAAPMNLGLDLRGGMYFLLDVDTPAVVDNLMQNYAEQLREGLRGAHLRYASVESNQGMLTLQFHDKSVLSQAENYIQSHFPDLQMQKNSAEVASESELFSLQLRLLPQAQTQMESYALAQTVNVMRNRVNELGVAEASVAQQGPGRVVIELPGLQDAAKAKEIIGGTSTLKVMLVNESADLSNAVAGQVPPGSKLYMTEKNQPVVLYDSVIITGNSVIGANAGFDSQSNQPIVSVTLSGPEVSKFSDVTAANVGHLMAIVLVDESFTKTVVDGQVQTKTQETDKVVSVANILQRLDNRFQITGLSAREAQSLALSIRAGALPAPVQIVEEKHIGPSLGAENIKMGAISVAVAMISVMLFIAFYYHLFGLIANITLILNLIFIVALMSIMPGATLTLPGIAGVVLNVGMAIDANVLIFERIREELRNGSSVQSAIYTGYGRAFSTIVDSNVTTLIVSVILFSIGSGAVKGFSVTLMIGIVTSMFTSLLIGRAMVNALFGLKPLKWLPIGIRPPKI